MCGRRFVLISLALSWAPFLLAAQSTSLAVAQASSSTPTSPQVEQLWSELLSSTKSLPGQYQSFVDSLQARVAELQKINSSLAAQNKDLTNSLAISEMQAATLAEKSKQLQADLNASTSSITRAQAEAKGLELQVSGLRIGLYIAGAALAVGGIYEGGQVLRLW